MRVAAAFVLLLWATTSLATSEWVREIEILAEPEVEGQRDFTIRITPAKSGSFDALTFACVYHQEFPWVNVRGKRYTKIHEPVRFEYQRSHVKLVNDLDAHVSFRVPSSRARLEEKYGVKTFNPDAPITIDRVIITAETGGAETWSFELKVPGKYVIAELPGNAKAGAEPED